MGFIGPLRRIVLALLCGWSVASATEVEVVIPPNIQRSAVVSGQGYFPVALRLKDGRIAVVMRGGAPHLGMKGRLDIVFSSDEGRTWTKPRVVVDSPLDDRNPAFGQADYGTLVVAFWRTGQYDAQGRYDTHIPNATSTWVTHSSDGGKSWSDPSEIDVKDIGWGSPYGKILTLPDGTMLMNIYGEQVRKLGEDVADRQDWSYLYGSRDGGKTWLRDSVIGPHRFNETALLSLGSNRLLAAMRSKTEDVWTTRSNDEGKTWSSPQKVTPMGIHPADLCLLDGGRILMVCGNRVGPFGVVALASDANGTFDWDRRLPVVEDATNSDCGYPSSVTLKQGGVFTVYYAVGSKDHPEWGTYCGAARHGAPTSDHLPLARIHPAVVKGMALSCWGDRLAVGPGRLRLGDQVVACRGGGVQIPAPETISIDRLPMTLAAGPVQTWHGGNRLVIGAQDARNLLPGSYAPGSLELIAADDVHTRFSAPNDFKIDDTWGAFSIPADGRLKAGQKVLARYRVSQRRVDALVVDTQGKVRLINGEPASDCPNLPTLPKDTVLLAHIYRPFNSGRIELHHVYLPAASPVELPAIRDAESLQPVLTKLREGKDVTVVCWGDSVTKASDVRPPEKAYVPRFEALLRERFPKAKLKVINAGIDGSNTSGRLPSIQKEVLDFHPDLVTLEFVNDMGAPRDQILGSYGEILKRTRDAGAALLIITPHFVMPTWMPLPDGRGADPRATVSYLREFASENHIPLADASRRWERLESLGIPYEIMLINGINHPDARGHQVFAEELMRFFPSE